MSIFEEAKDVKLEKLDQAIDAIRNKFGEDAIKRAVFVGSKLDHMADGLAKEKSNPHLLE